VKPKRAAGAPGKRQLRLAGSRWRILVHERIPGQRMSGKAWNVTSDPRAPEQHEATLRKLDAIRPDMPPADRSWSEHIVLEGTEFDELVIGRWIHLEQMNIGQWWINIGGVTINVTADRDGRPKFVLVQGPGDYDDPVPGCRYQCAWSRADDDPGKS
jgi:hypothetical protein